MLARFRPYLTFWLVAGLAIFFDWWSKYLVVRHIPFGTYFEENIAQPPIHLTGWFWLVHVGNKGAAWGMGSQYEVQPFLLILAFLVLFFVWWSRRSLLREIPGGQWAFGLFVGGILGNVHDRLFGWTDAQGVMRRLVVDFLDVHLPYYRFPAFNIADSCICVGVGLYLLLAYRQDAVRRAAIASHAGEDHPPLAS
jgi:signal peptidase II